MKKREPSIELFRLCLMVGICWLHACCQGKFASDFPTNVLGICIPGFVLITGFFGATFSLSKALRLYCLMAYSCFLIPLIGGGANYWHEVYRLWHPNCGWWFLNAYVIMLALASLVRPLFVGQSSSEVIVRSVMPVLLVVFLWGGLLNFNITSRVVHSVTGLQMQSFIVLFGVYLVGRLVARWQRLRELSGGWLLLSAGILFFAVSCSRRFLCHINCLIIVALTVLVFESFRRIRVSPAASRLIMFVAPSMFAVYCLQGQLYFPNVPAGDFSLINMLMHYLTGHEICLQVSYFVTAVCVFTICVVVDLPRRLVVWFFRSQLRSICGAVDGVFDRFLVWTAARLGSQGEVR